jgi:hypothetical protein
MQDKVSLPRWIVDIVSRMSGPETPSYRCEPGAVPFSVQGRQASYG